MSQISEEKAGREGAVGNKKDAKRKKKKIKILAFGVPLAMFPES